MKIANIVLAGAAVLTILGSTALAQQGMITKIDRIRGTIAIQQEQSGTVGASTGGATEEFKAQDRSSLDTVHVGDKVTYSTTEAGGMKTITKLQKQ
ncbi:MAG: copper-binding protein [Afipia sp.]|nr:copper-binding protein [Afipia sp.]